MVAYVNAFSFQLKDSVQIRPLAQIYIMDYLNNYNTYLLERKSISDSCEILQETISKDLHNILINFNNINLSNEFTYELSENDLKLDNIKVIFNLYKYKENVCNSVARFNNSKMSNDILSNIEIVLDIYISDKDEIYFNDYIDSVILHECLHIFQYYNISKNNKFRSSSWSIGVILSQFRNNFKSDYINNIIELLYKTLSHEIDAQIHQYYYFSKIGKKYNKIFDNIKDIEKFNIKKLSNIEEIELNLLKDKIYQSIYYYSKNKKYIKKLNKSIWKETNNDKFLIDLKELFDIRLKYIKSKISSVDNRINEGNLEFSSIPSAIFHKDFNRMYLYDPIFFKNLLNENFNIPI